MIHSTNLKSLSRFALIFTILFSLISSNFLLAQEQIGRPIITNYSYEDYKADPTNWWATEDEKGILYFANNDGVLMFDGVNWNLIELPNSGVRSLAQDEKGRIHVGGNGDRKSVV